MYDYRYPLFGSSRKARPAMRQRIFGPARRRREGGAVLVIVTLSLIALFGHDGPGSGRRIAPVHSSGPRERRRCRCARCRPILRSREGVGTANAQASQYTVANESGAAVASGFPKYFPSCNSPAGSSWTVRVSTDRPLFFAPVLGFDESTQVATEATASWGGAGVGEKVAPLMLSADRLKSPNCDIHLQTHTRRRTGSAGSGGTTLRADPHTNPESRERRMGNAGPL